jgi:hypothetical protein
LNNEELQRINPRNVALPEAKDEGVEKLKAELKALKQDRDRWRCEAEILGTVEGRKAEQQTRIKEENAELQVRDYLPQHNSPRHNLPVIIAPS